MPTHLMRIMVKPSNSLSVIIPVYNEADVIEKVVREFYQVVIQKHSNAELIVCEDGSTDGTVEILRRLENELRIKYYHSDERKGYLKGVREALQKGTNEWIFFSDSDNTHDPKDAWRLIEETEKKHLGLCTGEKRERADPFYRKLFSFCFSLLVKIMFGVKQHSINTGFKLMNREIVENIVPKVKYMKYGFSSELTIRVAKAGYKYGGVPVKHFPRKTGDATQINLKTMHKVIREQYIGMKKLKKELKKQRRKK